MTGVRSFDIKAYDDSFAGYVDLGWGDDSGSTAPARRLPPRDTHRHGDRRLTACLMDDSQRDGYQQSQQQFVQRTYAHEGRIPPLVTTSGSTPGSRTRRIGDDRRSAPVPGSSPPTRATSATTRQGVIRLRRVWDSWSTDYTRAPASGLHPDDQAADRPALRAAGLPVVPAAVPDAAAGDSDPDPGGRPPERADEGVDHPARFQRQALIGPRARPAPESDRNRPTRTRGILPCSPAATTVGEGRAGVSS